MQTYSAIQATTQKRVAEAMELIGCKIEPNPDGPNTLFTYGGDYYLASPSDGLTYLCVVFPGVSKVADFSSLAAANEAIHKLNARVKLARVWIDDGQIHAASETMLDGGMQLDQVLKQLLKTLQKIALETRVSQRLSSPRLSSPQNAQLEPDNLKNTAPLDVVSLH